MQADVGNIADPDLIRIADGQIFDQVWIALVGMITVCGALFGTFDRPQQLFQDRPGCQQYAHEGGSGRQEALAPPSLQYPELPSQIPMHASPRQSPHTSQLQTPGIPPTGHGKPALQAGLGLYCPQHAQTGGHLTASFFVSAHFQALSSLFLPQPPLPF